MSSDYEDEYGQYMSMNESTIGNNSSTYSNFTYHETDTDTDTETETETQSKISIFSLKELPSQTYSVGYQDYPNQKENEQSEGRGEYKFNGEETEYGSSESSFQPRDSSERPIIKMSVGLLNTYKKINQLYYSHKSILKKEQFTVTKNVYDDENYNYLIKENEIFAGSYQIIKLIGVGSFGQVVRAFDLKNQKEVAIKIIKSYPAFYEQGLIEKKILKKLNAYDSNEKYHTVKLINSFKFRKHLCLVFELLSLNLYEILKKTKLRGVSIFLVKKFAIQLAETLQFLRSKQIQIIHCDLKPENVLLVNPRKSLIKVIDFGSSCDQDSKIHTYIQSRFYRSPEILLQMKYSYPIDMWSLGCMLVELRTGKPLFPGRNEFEQMQKIVEVLGIPPDHILNNAPGTTKFFQKNRFKKWVFKKRERKENIQFKKRNLNEILKIPNLSSNYNYKSKLNNNNNNKNRNSNGRRTSSNILKKDVNEVDYSIIYEHLQFKDLIERMLDYDPQTRITPVQVIKHPFFQNRSHKSTQTKHNFNSFSNSYSSELRIKQNMKLQPQVRTTLINQNKYYQKKKNKRIKKNVNKKYNFGSKIDLSLDLDFESQFTTAIDTQIDTDLEYYSLTTKSGKSRKGGVWRFQQNDQGCKSTNHVQTQFD
ncbi:serine/threonine-protein kinase minibrain [Anaeramoeba flamelloides]|uniref:Serine/threonine-protein kinase minibrain n=1 Tax=Anaeramoeba flamelloides TaxID=1746091 RepID=A0ABQ8XVA9_9EUKA|nr:serine/threonine-protein kinase minibrain [Anaeramoeba flamelloides]